jgi:predicted transcriptional regulator
LARSSDNALKDNALTRYIWYTLLARKTAKKKTELVSARVSKTVKSKLEDIALENDRPLSWVVSKILEKYANSKQAGKL